jgi:hypothetical protein
MFFALQVIYLLSEPGTLFIIVLVNTTLILGKDFLIPRGEIYALEVKIPENIRKYEETTMRAIMTGTYQDCMDIISPVEIQNNIILEIY